MLHAPPGDLPRARAIPVGTPASAPSKTPPETRSPTGSDASRFLGATFDPVGLYRLNAVFDLLDTLGLTVQDIHQRVQTLQGQFLERLATLDHQDLAADRLVAVPSEGEIGHFLTFRTPRAGDLHRALLERQVITDYRDDRLRIGFGLYHDPEDVQGALRQDLQPFAGNLTAAAGRQSALTPGGSAPAPSMRTQRSAVKPLKGEALALV